jgi:hypothetical protein
VAELLMFRCELEGGKMRRKMPKTLTSDDTLQKDNLIKVKLLNWISQTNAFK